MVKCSFCANEIEVGTGKTLIQKDGKIHHFCSRKCEKNQVQLGRVGRNHKWTTAYKLAREAASKKK
jgi:large subunit ribosomal protein L24e